MNVTAACSSAIRAEVAAVVRPAEVLGAVDTALYLKLSDVVLAVLSADAVRLPCAVTLGSTSTDLPLRGLRPLPQSAVLVGSDEITWTAADGPVRVRATREWAPARPGPVVPHGARIAELQARLGDLCALADAPDVRALAEGADDAHAPLLGSGSGLTPSGDDVLAGFLVAVRAYGGDAAPLAEAIAHDAPRRTTALSAQLLRHAARGECIPELAAFIRATGSAAPLSRELDRLLSVGHTSGAGLAVGVAVAALGQPSSSRAGAAL